MPDQEASNPFRPPVELAGDEVVDEDEFIRTDRLPSKRFLLRWALSTCLNAVVPMMFASAIVHQNAYWVVVLGVILVFVTGALVSIRFPQVQRPLLAGSYAMGLAQLFPIIHVFAGIIAYTILQAMGLTVPQGDFFNTPMVSPLSILLLTFLVAAMLAVVAVGIGFILIMIVDSFKSPVQKSNKPIVARRSPS